jgi:ribose transport system ATP-binding protein/inositol transport system ATP-binding protein
MIRETGKLLAGFGLDLDPCSTVASLSVAQQQMVEICRAMSMDARIIIMDEPTATLSPKEVEQLFNYIRALKKRHISIIYVSHRIEELFEISDRVSVYRDGRYIRTYETCKTDRNDLVSAMVGRKLGDFYRKTGHVAGAPLLEVRHLGVQGILHDICFTLNRGEILGFTGIVGAGRTELAEALFGIRPYDNGEILLDGTIIRIQEPADAISAGMGLVPESRKEHGLNLTASVADNMTIQVLGQFMKFCMIDRERERQILEEHVTRLSIKVPNIHRSVAKLSGGNQQKVVIAKWLALHSRILILDEPTRGIDVGAKTEIYQIMNTLVENGVSIIMISSELPEVLNMCDRILVMHAGKITAGFDQAEATQEKIMQFATGLSAQSAQEEQTV